MSSMQDHLARVAAVAAMDRSRSVPAMFRNTTEFLAAKAAGERTFNPGQKCWHGHLAHRTVGHGKCVTCEKIRRVRRAAKTPKAYR